MRIESKECCIALPVCPASAKVALLEVLRLQTLLRIVLFWDTVNAQQYGGKRGSLLLAVLLLFP
jgi:hypothetical protein